MMEARFFLSVSLPMYAGCSFIGTNRFLTCTEMVRLGLNVLDHFFFIKILISKETRKYYFTGTVSQK